MTRRPSEVADLLHLEEKVLQTPAEFDEILQRTPTELQHNRALEKSMLFQEQLDKLVASAPPSGSTRRLNCSNTAGRAWVSGCAGWAEEVLKADGSPHDGEQTDGPSIVPPEETDEVTKEVNQFLASAEKNK